MGTMQLSSYTGQDTDSVTPAACDISSLSFSSYVWTLVHMSEQGISPDPRWRPPEPTWRCSGHFRFGGHVHIPCSDILQSPWTYKIPQYYFELLHSKSFTFSGFLFSTRKLQVLSPNQKPVWDFNQKWKEEEKTNSKVRRMNSNGLET